jgi:hypothetical protein
MFALLDAEVAGSTSTCYVQTLKALGIYSRGRFGAWLYEVSNVDHSVMQGAQATSNIMHGSAETILEFPGWTNGRYHAQGMK